MYKIFMVSDLHPDDIVKSWMEVDDKTNGYTSIPLRHLSIVKEYISALTNRISELENIQHKIVEKSQTIIDSREKFDEHVLADHIKDNMTEYLISHKNEVNKTIKEILNDLFSLAEKDLEARVRECI